MKKILVNAFSAKVGGGKTYIVNLLQRMPNEDFRLYIYLPDDMSIPEDKRIIRLRTKWPTENPIFRSFWEQFILPCTLKKLEIDILFCPGGVYNTPKSKQYKIVTMFRNMLPFDPRILFSSDSWFEKIRGILRKRVMLKSMTKADLVIFISNFARKVIESQAVLNKAVTIPHGISKPFYVFDKQLPRPELPFTDKYILYVSRFEFYKRHMEVAKAYAKLPENIKQSHKLLLVGGTDLPYGTEVIEYVRKNNIQGIHFLGDYPYSKLPDLYKNAELIIFASTCENCPNILLESLGAGVPVLSSNYDPMPEFGGTAITYMNPDDPDDIADKIKKILSKEILQDRNEIKSQADKYAWEITAEKTWKELLSI